MQTVLRDGLPCAVYRATLDQCPRLDIREWVRLAVMTLSGSIVRIDHPSFNIPFADFDYCAIVGKIPAPTMSAFSRLASALSGR
jgi:hypothetical protein